MDPSATGRAYDEVAQAWQDETSVSYGIEYLERAVRFTKNRGPALDIGCGSQGRMIELLLREGFQPEGLDVSAQMIALARQRHPEIAFHEVDVAQWDFPRQYDFIVAWDSTWHLPLELQEPVLRKICHALAPGGVHLFTAVGLDEPGDRLAKSCWGFELNYGVLGIPKLLRILTECGCAIRHLEFDQYPEQHLVVIAQKV